MDIAKLGFGVDTNGLVKGRNELDGFTKSTDKADKSMKTAGSTAKYLGAALGAISASFTMAAATRTIVGFEDSMLRLQATSSATAAQMGELERQSRSLGATSRYSAQQSADAQNFLAMAGFSVNEIMSATPNIMKFASAASLDLARSADIASNVLGGMQLPVDQLERVMGAMIVTAQSANTNVNQLGEAFAYAAPLAVTAAIDIETLAAATGVLGDAGIQGGRAGTGLVGVIRQLSKVSKDGQDALAGYGLSVADVDIKSKGLHGVLESLRKANLSTTDAIRIFGSESAAAGLILAAQSDKVRDLTAANMEAEGKLDDVANLLDSGLSAAFASVNSAIEEMMLSAGDRGLSKTLKLLSITTAGVISNLNGMLPEFAKANGLSDEFAQNITIATNALKVLGATVGVWAAIRLAIIGATQAQLAFNLAARANPYVLIASSIAAAAVMLYQFTASQENAAIATKKLWDDAVNSAAGYQVAAANLTQTQNTLNSLHHRELKLQDEINAMREKGFKVYSRTATKVKEKEEELAKIQQQRRDLLDSKIAADIAEGKRIEENNKHQAEANRLQEELLKIQGDISASMSLSAAEIEAAAKAHDQLQESYKQALDNLNRQIQLGEDATEVEKQLYEIQHGRLVGLLPAQQSMLTAMAKELDVKKQLAKEDERKKDTVKEAESILQQLMTEEELIEQSYQKRRDTMLQLATDTGLDITDALTMIEQERAERLLEINGTYWERYLLKAQESVGNFDRLTEDMISNLASGFGSAFESMVFDAETLGGAVQNLMQGMARSVINALGQMAAQWLIYQTVQRVANASAAAGSVAAVTGNASAASILAGLNAYASTAAIPIVGPAAAPAAMSAAMAATSPLVTAATAAASSGLVGMAHDGIDSVPREGTWLLDKGERVMTSDTSAKLDRALDNLGKNSGGNNFQAVVNVQAVEGMSTDDARRQGNDIMEGMSAQFDMWLADRMQPGGPLWQG